VVREMGKKRKGMKGKEDAVLAVNARTERNDQERDGEGECRFLIDHYYSGKLTARDVVCKECINRKEESVIEEAVCPCDCDAQLVSERYWGGGKTSAIRGKRVRLRVRVCAESKVVEVLLDGAGYEHCSRRAKSCKVIKIFIRNARRSCYRPSSTS
jgi:hypothetical protein